MCLLAICMSFLGKYLFVSCAHFLGVEFEKFFIDRGYQPFICNIICKCLLRFHRLILVLLIVCFAVQKLVNLMKCQSFIFAFISIAFIFFSFF